MKMIKENILVIVVAGCAVVLVGMILKENIIEQKSVSGKIDTTVSPTPPAIYEYKNETSKYAITIPGNWGVKENATDPNFESRAVINPGDENLKIKEIDVTVVTNPKETQPFSKVSEFETWSKYSRDTVVDGVKKIDTASVSGTSAILLLNPKDENSDWNVMAWFKKDNKNIYINMIGRDEFTTDDEDVFKLLLTTFRWLD